MVEQYQKFLKYSIWVAIILFIIICLRCGLEPIINLRVYDIFEYIGETIFATFIIMGLYEKILWKYLTFDSMPVLENHYNGKLISTYDMQEREIELEIKQTFLSVKVILKTNESKSKSINASILKIGDEWHLIYNYMNEPKVTVRDRSPIHYGTTTLCIENPNHLEGEYYTDRKTTGTLELVPNIKSK